VVIYDDMIRSGGSLLRAAEAYRSAGASDVRCVATHGVLPGDSLDQIRHSGLISKIICTNSHPRAVELSPEFPDLLQVRSVARVFVDVLNRARKEVK
jgi:ribose-phosphate pyrophosphokinase